MGVSSPPPPPSSPSPSLTEQLAEYALKRDLPGFHQWLFTAKDHKNLDFDDVNFRRSYAEKIFSLSPGTVTIIWQLFLEHFNVDDQDRVALFSAFLAHARLLDGRSLKPVLETSISGSLEPLLQQTSTLIADFSPVKEGHLLSLYFRLLGLKMLLAQTVSKRACELHQNKNANLFDLSDVFEQTNSGQWTELYENFEQLPGDVQLTYAQLMITKHRYLKISVTSEVEVGLEELMIKLVECNNTALVRVDVFTPVLPILGQSSMAAALDYLLQLFTTCSSNDDQQLYQRIEDILSDADIWELGGLRFQAAYITALIKAVIRATSISSKSSSRSGEKRKSPEDELENQNSSNSVLEILASKEKLWAKESRTTLTNDSSSSKENKIPSLLRSASAAFLEMIREHNSSNKKVNKSSKSNSTVILRLLDLLLTTVPLEHLTPVGQLRTILLLSTVLISNSISGVCELRQLASAFVTANRRIWASVRSVWLFDYLPPAEYIMVVLVSLLKCSTSKSSEFSSGLTSVGQLDSACYSLFNDYLISNVFQLYDLPRSRRNVESLVEVLNGGKDHKGEVENLEYVLVMLQTMLLRANAAFIKKLTNSGAGKLRFNDAHREAFEAIGAQVGAAIYRNIKIYLDTASSSSNIESSEFVVEGLTRLFEFKVFAEAGVSSSEEEGEAKKIKSKWRKLLTRFIAISLENIGKGSEEHEELSEVGDGRKDQQQQHFVNFLRVVVLNRARLYGYSLSEDFVGQLWAKMTTDEAEEKVETEIEEESSHNFLQEKIFSETHWRRLFTSKKSLSKFRRFLEQQQTSYSTLEQQLAAYDRRLETFRPLFGPLATGATAEEWDTVLLPSAAQMLSGCLMRNASSSSLARSLFAIRVLLELIGNENKNENTEKSKDLGADKNRLLADHYHLLLSGLINVNLVAGKVGDNVTKSNPILLGRVKTDSVLLTRALLFRLTAAGLLSNAHLFLAFNLAAECAPVGLLPPGNSTATTTNLPNLLPTFTALFTALNGLLQELLTRRPHLLLYSMGGGSHGTLLVGMLTALLRAADENNEGAGLMGVNSTDAEKLALEQCSAAFAQTISGLCRAPSAADEFRGGAFAEHLLAAYLHQAPGHTVAPFVRKHLNGVVFSLIDLLQVDGGGNSKTKKKNSSILERLYSAVGAGPRELLGRLLEQYDKYHRFKGYV